MLKLQVTMLNGNIIHIVEYYIIMTILNIVGQSVLDIKLSAKKRQNARSKALQGDVHGITTVGFRVCGQIPD